MKWKRVSIKRLQTVSPEPGIFESLETQTGIGYIILAPARSNVVYTATIREQTVTHEGWARTNTTWKAVEIGDVIAFGTRRLLVNLINEEGEIDSRWLRFELDERSLKEESGNE